MSLSLDEVRKVARLARLELTESELPVMLAQLNQILNYVDHIQQLNTDDIEPLAHPLPVNNVFRSDEPVPSLPVEEALQNAPVRFGSYFGVPAVFDSDGSASS